jgi:transcriptional regulator with XRE-family HTH domain
MPNGLVTVIGKPDKEPRAAGAARRLLARRMRILRATHGWSQEVLAELAGLHRSYISGIERTSRNVSVDNIEKIALAFGVSMAELCRSEHLSVHAPQKGLFGYRLR